MMPQRVAFKDYVDIQLLRLKLKFVANMIPYVGATVNWPIVGGTPVLTYITFIPLYPPFIVTMTVKLY